jgi:hypothetical protein
VGQLPIGKSRRANSLRGVRATVFWTQKASIFRSFKRNLVLKSRICAQNDAENTLRITHFLRFLPGNRRFVTGIGSEKCGIQRETQPKKQIPCGNEK